MAENSKTKVSPACDHCYAESWAKRAGNPELWSGERRRTSISNWRKPILFSAPMVRAILDGRKTQTRRVSKPQYENRQMCESMAKWQVGDMLWVREAFAVQSELWASGHGPQPIHYLADTRREEIEDYLGKPSIHMPRWASRITLRVTGVKVERLQDITEEDAKAEGAMQWEAPKSWVHGTTKAANTYYFDQDLNERLYEDTTARGAYEILWGKINGWNSWDANPWVVAISFERVTP